MIQHQVAELWMKLVLHEIRRAIGNNFQFRRFQHLKTVERIIGHKYGTGGSSGGPFLKRAIDLELFPEWIRVRTEIGQ
jgi:tryptophan 2,3-dioxygenase